MSFIISTPVSDTVITGRNGTYYIKEVQLHLHERGDNIQVVAIEGVGKRGFILNAGIYSIPASAMDKLCLEYLYSRGILERPDEEDPREDTAD